MSNLRSQIDQILEDALAGHPWVQIAEHGGTEFALEDPDGAIKATMAFCAALLDAVLLLADEIDRQGKGETHDPS